MKHTSNKEIKIRFRVGYKWGKWQDWENMIVPDDASACETKQLMKMSEVNYLRKKGLIL